MNEWNLRSRSRACNKCGAEFADGAKCRSAAAYFTEPFVRELFADKNMAKTLEYVRVDFCEPCWEALAAVVPPPDFISAWQGPYTATAPETPEALPKETAETLLRRMLEHGGDDATPAVIFVLAVMLERKRVLLERNVRRGGDGTLTRVYEHRKTGEIMLIPDPALGLDEIPGTQQQIDLLLGIGAETPAPPDV